MRKKILFLMLIAFLLFIFIAFIIALNSNVSDDIKTHMKMQYNKKIYSVEEIEDVYFQPQARAARSFYLTFQRINSFLPINHIVKSRVYSLQACSFIYYTYFELEESMLYILFDKKGNEIYSFILNKTPPESDQFNGIEINKSTLEDIQSIDKSTYLFETVPKIYNINEPLLDIPYSIHITKDLKIIRVSYQKKNNNYIVSNISDFSADESFNIHWFLKEVSQKNN